MIAERRRFYATAPVSCRFGFVGRAVHVARPFAGRAGVGESGRGDEGGAGEVSVRELHVCEYGRESGRLSGRDRCSAGFEHLFAKVVHRLPMPNVGDELHHYGWNICSACHGRPGDRRYLIVPGLKSSRIHIVDALDPLKLKLEKVIEPEEIARKVNLSAPHTVHCLPDESVMISMLGDAAGQRPRRISAARSEVQDRRPLGERSRAAMKFNYDFWYQPRAGVMISTEWAAPNTFGGGFNPDDVQRGKYGQRLNVWDWQSHELRQTIDLGERGLDSARNPARPRS